MDEQKEIKYSSYTEAQRRATKKYRENNKEKVNEQRKKYYQCRKAKDPKFLEYKRIKAREYYQKKKAIKKAVDEKIEENQLKTNDNEEIKIDTPVPIQEPINIPIFKGKRKYTRKNN